MVFCGRDTSARRNGRRLGTRLQCFKKGVGVGIGIEKRKQIEIPDRNTLNGMNLQQLRILASKNNITITHTINGVNRRKNKSQLIQDLINN